MTFAFTVITIIFLLLLSAFLYIGHNIFDALDHRFLYIVAGILVLVFGAGIFLTHAVPSLANANPFGKKADTEMTVTQDDPAGMTLQEE